MKGGKFHTLSVGQVQSQLDIICGIKGWLHNCSNVSILDLEVKSSEDSNPHKREVSPTSMIHYEASADFTTPKTRPPFQAINAIALAPMVQSTCLASMTEATS